ncbi:MAG: hypothetical protein MK095_06380 [Phycisphaerales bacterium]|nr:hypothetical protein [Phycisphaerales bacterium]
MNTPSSTPEVEAAMALWPVLLPFAQQSHELSGPGAVLMERARLLEPEGDGPVMNYIAAEDVPAGDDFRPLMLQYDPARQVVLILGGAGAADELVLVLEQQS